jgi:mycothiol synthase
MSDADVADVMRLLDAAAAADGHPALDDHLWLDLVDGGHDGFAGFLAWGPDRRRPLAYAQASRANDSWALQLVIDPEHRPALATTGAELLGAALVVVGEDGGGRVNWWVAEPSAEDDALAEKLGLRPGRLLHQMRRRLPTGLASVVTTRPFEVGRDEETWLEVNNRAFDGHPEQGGWDLDMLHQREKEPWFDPAGFRLHERDGRLAAFCWTKVHADQDPVLGEIYVIGVDPDFQGLGLGRALTLAGLDHMAGEGVPVGMLFVDADNDAALGLYGSLGFSVHRSDRAYVGEVRP